MKMSIMNKRASRKLAELEAPFVDEKNQIVNQAAYNLANIPTIQELINLEIEKETNLINAKKSLKELTDTKKQRAYAWAEFLKPLELQLNSAYKNRKAEMKKRDLEIKQARDVLIQAKKAAGVYYG